MEIGDVKIEKIWYKHYRYEKYTGQLLHYSRGRTRWTPTCKGGLTTCIILDENGSEWYGEAECSRKDNFVYSIGRQIAFGRAKKAMLQHYELPF